MPKPATGELRRLSEGFEAYITIEGHQRKAFRLAPMPEEAARERCTLLAQLAQRMRRAGQASDAPKLLEMAALASTPERLEGIRKAVDTLCTGQAEKVSETTAITFRQFAEKWVNGKLQKEWPDHMKKRKDTTNDESRLRNHVYPVIGSVPLAGFTLEHGEAVMRALPEKLGAGTRRHVARLLTRIVGVAVYPCRIIATNPLPKGFVPKKNGELALQYLYPDEDALLLKCKAVPLCYRMLYGFLAREGMRRGEAERLTWGDLDLERGAIRLDENKTDHPRAWALDPGVVRALKWWKDSRDDTSPTDRVFIDEYGRPLDVDKLAEKFRKHLELAGVERAELFTKSATRRPIRAHDLRATFITISLANGKTETWVMDRTGHTTSAMLNRYRRAARSFTELGQGPLTPLDQAIDSIPLGLPLVLRATQDSNLRPSAPEADALSN